MVVCVGAPSSSSCCDAHSTQHVSTALKDILRPYSGPPAKSYAMAACSSHSKPPRYSCSAAQQAQAQGRQHVNAAPCRTAAACPTEGAECRCSASHAHPFKRTEQRACCTARMHACPVGTASSHSVRSHAAACMHARSPKHLLAALPDVGLPAPRAYVVGDATVGAGGAAALDRQAHAR